MQQFTARDLQRNIGQIQDAAIKEPIAITHHGRERLVILSSEEYRRLKRRDRVVIRAEDMPESLLRAIAKARVPRRRSKRRG